MKRAGAGLYCLSETIGPQGDSPTEQIITQRITSEHIMSERINTERITYLRIMSKHKNPNV
jgi:hypothetical protein